MTNERLVAFTVLEDGLYLPSVGGALPPGEYRGRMTYRDGVLDAVYITLNGGLLARMGVDRSGRTLNWNINYSRAGMNGNELLDRPNE